MAAPLGAAPDADPPGAVSEAALLQAAVETFVDQHATGEAPSPDAFVQKYPESVRPRLLAQIREFLAFDGLLGHQEWEPKPAAETSGRAFGDFTIQEELGRGGMGIVYLAWQRSLHRRVALKVMASGLTLSKRHVERFRREAAAAAQVRHPAIVPVHSFTEVDGTFAFAMDYVAGRNLADVLDDLRLANGDGPAPVEGSLGLQPEKGYVAECALLCAQLASALAAAHQAGVVHRDLKPRNVMVDDRRQARLLDFGLAKSLGEGSISMSGEITGTAHYMSPEQTLAKRVPIDHRADIWALGVILFELLTLRRPFDGKNLQQVVYEICFKEPPPPQRHNPKVPRDLSTICQKALEKDPQNRYQTAAEFEADLLRFLRWEPIHARPAGPLQRLGKWLHRHRTEAVLAGSLALAGIATGGWLWWDGVTASRRADQLLAAARTAAGNGDYEAATRHATEALLLRDDPAGRKDVELYQEKSLVAATKKQKDIAESRRLGLESKHEAPRNRELALLLALEAFRIHPSAESRSAVLDALGSGYRITKFEVPGQPLFAARWSPDGALVATAGTDGPGGNAHLWRADGTLLARLDGHRQHVLDVAFHPRGELVATAGIDGTVRLWRTRDGSAAGTWQHDGSVSLVRFDGSGERAVTVANPGGRDATARPCVVTVWDTGSGRPLATCASHRRAVGAATLSPCGRYVASHGDRGFVRLWDAATGAELAQLPGQWHRPYAVVFSKDSSLCAVADQDGSANLYAVPAGQRLAGIAHSQPIDALCFDDSGERLLSAGRDLTARLWRIQREADGGVHLRELRTFVGHESEVAHAAFDPSGRLLVTAAHDGVLRVFDASAEGDAKGVELLRYEVGGRLQEASFAADGRAVLASTGPRAMAWHFADSRGVVTLRQRGPVAGACFDPTGDRVTTAGDDECLRQWHAHDGRLLWTTPKLGSPLLALDVDDRGERCVIGRHDGKVQVHRSSDGALLYTLGQHQGQVPLVRFAADGSRVLSVGQDKLAVVWNANDQTRLAEFPTAEPLAAADLSPDGRRLATAARGSLEIQLWDVADRRLLATLRGHTEAVRTLRFRPDGQALLSAGLDGQAITWSLAGERLATLPVGAPVLHVAWSRDQRQVLTSAAQDKHLTRLWQLADGNELLRCFGGDTVQSIALSPDGHWALSAAKDGTTSIWPTDPVTAAARLHLRSLTTAERNAYLSAPTEPK